MIWVGHGKKNRQQPKSVSDVLTIGDIVYVENVNDEDGSGTKWELRQLPEVSGALIVIRPSYRKNISTFWGI